MNPKISVATETKLQTPAEASTDPWELYLYAIRAPATKAKYSQRLRKFLEFSGYEQATLEDKARAFAAKAKADTTSMRSAAS